MNHHVIIYGIHKAERRQDDIQEYFHIAVDFAQLLITGITPRIILIEQEPRLRQQTLHPVQEIERKRHEDIAIIECLTQEPQYHQQHIPQDSQRDIGHNDIENDTQEIPARRAAASGRTATCHRLTLLLSDRLPVAQVFSIAISRPVIILYDSPSVTPHIPHLQPDTRSHRRYLSSPLARCRPDIQVRRRAAPCRIALRTDSQHAEEQQELQERKSHNLRLHSVVFTSNIPQK